MLGVSFGTNLSSSCADDIHNDLVKNSGYLKGSFIKVTTVQRY